MAGNLADCMPTASCRLRPTPTRPSSEAPTSPARCSQARSHCFSLPCSFTCPSFPPLSLTLYGKEEMQEEKEIVPTNRRQLSLEDDLVWMHPWYYGSSGTTKSSSSLKGCMGIRRKD